MAQMKNRTLNCPRPNDLNCLCYLALMLNARFNVVGIFPSFVCSIRYGFMYVCHCCRVLCIFRWPPRCTLKSFRTLTRYFDSESKTVSTVFRFFSLSLYRVFCFRFVFVPVSTTKFTLLANTFFPLYQCTRNPVTPTYTTF